VCWCLAWLVSERLWLIDGAAAGTWPEVRNRDSHPQKSLGWRGATTTRKIFCSVLKAPWPAVGSTNAKMEGWVQRSQPGLSRCQEYRVRDPSLLIACEPQRMSLDQTPDPGIKHLIGLSSPRPHAKTSYGHTQTIALPSLFGPKITASSGTTIHSPWRKTR
jgi:hypothetical protein